MVISEITKKKYAGGSELKFGGAGFINGRTEGGDDVISGYNVETFRDYHGANL